MTSPYYDHDRGCPTAPFAELLIGLGVNLGRKPTEEQVRAYAKQLGDVPWPALVAVCIRLANEPRRQPIFFPTVPEIRAALGQPTADDAAVLAWSALCAAAERAGAYQNIHVEDPAAAEAVLAAFGSWPQFCATEDGPQLALKRQEFMAHYRTHRPSARGHRVLPGLCAQAGGYPTGTLAASVWAARITLAGAVENLRDRPQLTEGSHGPVAALEARATQAGEGAEEATGARGRRSGPQGRRTA